MKTPEKLVLRACMDYLRTLRPDIVAWRSNNAGVRVGEGASRYAFHGTKGVPDIVGVLPGGRFLGIECKSDIGRQSPEQEDMQERIEAAGGRYLLVRSAADLAEGLKETAL